jgi:hypothetical protein
LIKGSGSVQIITDPGGIKTNRSYGSVALVSSGILTGLLDSKIQTCTKNSFSVRPHCPVKPHSLLIKSNDWRFIKLIKMILPTNLLCPNIRVTLSSRCAKNLETLESRKPKLNSDLVWHFLLLLWLSPTSMAADPNEFVQLDLDPGGQKRNKKWRIVRLWNTVSSLLRTGDFSCGLDDLHGGLELKTIHWNVWSKKCVSEIYNFWSSNSWNGSTSI